MSMAMWRLRLWSVGMMVLAAALIAGCTAAGGGEAASANVVAALSGEADAGFARALAPIPFAFPADHGAHPAYRTEWWYFTGNLTDDAGNLYGFQFTVFRSALTPALPARASDLATNQIYMAHLALTDGRVGEHRSLERYSRGAGGLAGATGDPAFSVWLEDWSLTEVEPGVMRLAAAGGEGDAHIGLDLTLRETRPPVLHGEAGLSQKGPEPGNASYYYSLIGLATTGEVTHGDRRVAVTGRSWMDHEFGTSALSANAVGWDWFSVQLEDGAALMLATVRTADGGSLEQFTGAWVDADGRQTPIGAQDFTLAALDSWTSPTTGFTYPSGWTLSLPGEGVELTLEPVVKDQEMQVSFVYWEGAVTVAGSRAGAPVRGAGYVELTGYGNPAGADFQR